MLIFASSPGGPGCGASRGRRDNGERLDTVRPDRQSRKCAVVGRRGVGVQLPLQRLPEEATETAFHGAPFAGQDLALAADATAINVERADRRCAAAHPFAAVNAAVSASRQHLTLLRR